MPGGWTVASVLGHVAFWDQRIIALVEEWRRAGGGTPPKDVDGSQVDWINDATKPLLLAVAPRRAAELTLRSRRRRIGCWPSCRKDFLAANGKAGSPVNVHRAEHRREHIDEIETALKSEGRRSPWPDVQNEIEGAVLALLGVAKLHQQLGLEDPVPPIGGLSGKVELRSERRPIGCGDRHVNVPCPARIEAGHDGLEAVATGAVGELMPPQTIAGIVVLPAVVGLPEVDGDPGNGRAGRRQDHALDHEARAGHPRLEKRRAKR
jgi:hypothetical protein